MYYEIKKYSMNDDQDIFAQERAKWEAEHPGQDYDVYINNRIDEAKGN